MVRLLDFYADWCGPCKIQDEVLEEIEEEFEDDDVEIVRVDVETGEGKEKANEYGARSLPTLVLQDEEQDVIARFVGVTDKTELQEAINSAL